MLIVKLIENSGFLLLALAAAGFLLLLLRAFRNSRREARQEAREAAEKAETARWKAAAASALAAEKKATEEARLEAAETAKAARTAAAEEARKARQEAREAREAAAAEKLAEKLNAARLLAEYRERALAAARELQALETSAPVLRPADPAKASAEPSADPDPAPAPDDTPKPFAGHMVSFTGKMKSMTRPQAAEMVRQAGGRAFTKSMPVGTTLLVVGDTAGNDTRKLEKADEWIGQLRKITESQFLAMFNPS